MIPGYQRVMIVMCVFSKQLPYLIITLLYA